MVKVITTELYKGCKGPTIIVSISNRGNGNSYHDVRKFSVCSTLSTISSALARFNNRALTTNLNIRGDEVSRFHATVGRCTGAIRVPFPRLELSYGLGPTCVGVSLVGDLRLLRPFNTNGRRPYFKLFGVGVSEVAPVNSNGRLELTLGGNGARVATLLFSIQTRRFPFELNSAISTTIGVAGGRFHNRMGPDIHVYSVHFSNDGSMGCLGSMELCRGCEQRRGLGRGRLEFVAPGESFLTSTCGFFGGDKN